MSSVSLSQYKPAVYRYNVVVIAPGLAPRHLRHGFFLVDLLAITR
jgi:hypothetical protein